MFVIANHYSPLLLGTSAVYVFFVLSGFWLHTMWTGRYSKARQPYLTYLVSRLWRLTPLLLLATAVALIAGPLMGVPLDRMVADGPRLVFSSVFMLGYVWLHYQPIGPAWTLDVEMQFYLMVPLLSAMVLQSRRLFVLCAAAGSAFLMWRLPLHVLPTFAVFFAVGMAAAASGWRPSRGVAFGTAAALVLALVLLTLSPLALLLWGGIGDVALRRWSTASLAAVALAAVPFAIYTARRPSDARDRMFGDLSYIVYLGHWIGVMWLFARPGGWFIDRFAAGAVSLPILAPASWLVWRFYDRPIERARARWVESRLAPRPQPAQYSAAPAPLL